MIESLAFIILNVCKTPDNIKCVNYVLNCSVTSTDIKQQVVSNCIKKYNTGAKYE